MSTFSEAIGLRQGISIALLHPFGVLRHHRIDHLRERFVRRPHAVPAGEQIALEPAFATMLAQHFHHAAVGSEMIVDRNDGLHGAAIGRNRKRRSGGSSWSRRDKTCGNCWGSCFITSRKYSPNLRGASATTSPGPGTPSAYCAKSGRSSAFSKRPPFTLGFAPMRRFPSGASAAISAMSWPSLSNNFSGSYSRIQASSIFRCAGFSQTVESGT